jgi:threonyl-tRNA synthetase
MEFTHLSFTYSGEAPYFIPPPVEAANNAAKQKLEMANYIVDRVAENTALQKQIAALQKQKLEMANNIVDLVAENTALRKRNRDMEQRNAQDALRINALLSTVSKLVNKQLL